MVAVVVGGLADAGVRLRLLLHLVAGAALPGQDLKSVFQLARSVRQKPLLWALEAQAARLKH